MTICAPDPGPYNLAPTTPFTMSEAPINLSMAPIGDQHARRREAATRPPLSRAKNCAECRRLKIKCDRKLPCTNCVKRGCATICPDGALSSRGDRLVLTNTEDLHAKIEELTLRIQDLEAALATLQAQVSTEPHPLLSHNQAATAPLPRNSNDPDEAPISSFGSLMISDEGASRFFGATSGAEWVITFEPEPPDSQSEKDDNTQQLYENPLALVPDMALINAQFPHPIDPIRLNRPMLKQMVVQCLPPKEEAVELINLYYQMVAWETNPVSRTRLISEFFGPCYQNLQDPPLSSHSLALLHAVFGLGMLYHPQFSERSNHHFSLSRAALMIEDMVMTATITTIDTLILHVMYVRMAEGPGSGAKAWVGLGCAIKLAQTLGLHRDPSIWNLSPEETYHRRKTMWELVNIDLWSALYTGRPPMISRQHFDVQPPMDDPSVAEADPNYNRGKYVFSEMCLWPLLDVALAARGRTSYAAVLRMDKRIRDWKLPLRAQVNHYKPREDQQKGFNAQQVVIFIVREVALLGLHRSYFASAVSEPPFDPLRSRYSRSVLAAYASACAILVRIRKFYAQDPGMFRKSAFWTIHGFSAAVILGSMAASAPDCPLSASALIELDHTVDVFKSTEDVKRNRRLLPVLSKLQTKAHKAFSSYQMGTWRRPTASDPVLFPAMGGSGSGIVQPMHEHSPSTSSSSAPPPAVSLVNQTTQANQVDQAGSLANIESFLENYLRSFDTHATNSDGSSSHATASPMHVQSSDAFLRGALTGDWTGVSSAEASLLDRPIDLSAYHQLLQVPNLQHSQQQQQQQQQNVFAPQNPMVAPTEKSQFNFLSAHPSLQSQAEADLISLFGRVTDDQGSDMFSGSNNNTSSAPYGFFPSQPVPVADAAQPTAGQGYFNNIDDGQSTLLWDNFLNGLGVDNRAM